MQSCVVFRENYFIPLISHYSLSFFQLKYRIMTPKKIISNFDSFEERKFCPDSGLVRVLLSLIR